MNIGFWNINCSDNKKDLTDYLSSLTIEQELVIFCIAEISDAHLSLYLEKLNKLSSQKYSQIKSCKSKVKIVSNLKQELFTDQGHLYKSSRWVSQLVSIPNVLTFNLISVHFYSKVNWSDISLALECVNLSRDIQLLEETSKSNNTIVLGDFNMSPFESGMVASNGLNAISDLDYASKMVKGRKIDETYYSYFYNPMWNFYGDMNNPKGTHYYRVSGHVSHEWHIYDQIILRPSLKEYLANPFVEIVSKIHTEDLVKTFDRPHKEKYSDHLPIILKLKL